MFRYFSQWRRCWWTCSTYARTTSWWATETTGSKKVMSIITSLPLSSLIRYTFLAEILLSLYLSISLYICIYISIYIYIYTHISIFLLILFNRYLHWFLLHRDQSVPSCAPRFSFFMLERLTDWRECTYVIPFPIPFFNPFDWKREIEVSSRISFFYRNLFRKKFLARYFSFFF